MQANMLLHACGNGNAMAMAIANAARLEGCRASERITIKKAPRLISEEPPVTFMKENRYSTRA